MQKPRTTRKTVLMSRLTELLAELRKQNAQLSEDLEAEITAIAKQRSFGLVFERHQPEAVELPGLKPRKGSKVHVLPPRASKATQDQRLWLVEGFDGSDEDRTATLLELKSEEPERAEVPASDLVVVAEFTEVIYPGLIETGRVERGGDKPYNTVINGENYHALEMLTYTHRHEVDAIYIDPPYNTGAKDWKYNNDYVEENDSYRHSKWLAFMERRLRVAKELLKPEDSVLVVTIDEKEYLRLGMLLEQVFPEAKIQMVSILINPKGVSRGAFRRADEYAYFVMLGNAQPQRLPLTKEWSPSPKVAAGLPEEESTNNEVGPGEEPGWTSMMRRGSAANRSDRPTMFYPIYADPSVPKIVEVGEPVPNGQHDAPPRQGLVTILPLRRDGREGRWQIGRAELLERIRQGRVRLGRKTSYGYVVNYLPDGEYAAALSDRFEVTGKAPDGSIVAARVESGDDDRIAPTQWKVTAHNASEYGSTLLAKLLPSRSFPFPKSLYAVEDTLRFFVKDKPNATVIDFFAGSGTTAHAVMRLNRQDGGRRQCISITNNEVSADEQLKLRKQGLRAGEPEWEALGICDYITKPRIKAAITGLTPDGDQIKGDYKFTMSEGFDENAAFFTLTYESPLAVKHNRAFRQIAPMLWMRAGAKGRIIIDLSERGWDISEVYGVLERFDNSSDFLAALAESEGIQTVFLVTDDDAAYQMVCRDLPEGVAPVRLYSSYLLNFEINRGRY